MRSLFDQYDSPENRLTHALLCALDKDRRLLRSFVHWAVGRDVGSANVEVVGQGFPGDVVADEGEAERRGIPDGCVADGSEWALLIETKFAAAVSEDQLRRHLRSAVRHGLSHSQLLLLTVGPYEGRLPPRALAKQWLEVYAWLRANAKHSEWATLVAEYLEIAETKESQNGYLREGTLTMFTGIPFAHEPYNYPQAKRLLGLLREDLVRDTRLHSRLGAGLSMRGRKAIKGRKLQFVWDYIPLKAAHGAAFFTRYPHLTFSIHPDCVKAYATIPNGVHRRIRKNILGKTFEDFSMLIETVARNLAPMVKLGGVPMVALLQRHYASQSSPGVIDAELRFDLRTAFPTRKGRGKSVKHQPQWLRAAYATLRRQRTNLQLQVGVDFRYEDAPICGSKEIARAVADTWLACGPILKQGLD